MSKFWRNKSVLITGANGFLGAHLSVRLLKEGARVIGIIKENFPESFLSLSLKTSDKQRLKLIKTNIIYTQLMREIFKRHKPDICLHLAAQPIVAIANKSPLVTLETNVKGTWNILEACRINKIKAVVVASSDKAYGEHKKLPYTEDAPLLALHPYDASKACTDILARVYAYTYGLNIAVTRCANIFGPGDFNLSRIIPDTIHSVMQGKNPVIRSNGAPIRDYIYVDDIVAAYLILAKKLYLNKIKSGEAFNFGTGRPISVLSVVKKILKIAKRSDLAPRILRINKIKGEIDKQYLSSHKANKILGWKSRYTLDHGLQITFSWYAQHLR